MLVPAARRSSSQIAGMGGPADAALVDEAAAALGRVLAVLVTPSTRRSSSSRRARHRPGLPQARGERACRSLLAYPARPPLGVVASRLRRDGKLIGAALVAHAGGR